MLRGLNNQINALFGIEYLVEADRDAYQSNLALSYLLNSKNNYKKTDIDSNISDVTTNLEQINQRYNKFKNIYIDNKNLFEDFKKFEENYLELSKITSNILKLIEEDNMNAANDIFFKQYIKKFSVTREILNKFTDITLDIAVNKNKNSSFVVNNLVNIIITIIIFIIISLGIIAFWVISSISKPIKKIVANLSGSSEQIGISSQQLSQSSQSIANGATEQAASIEELSSMVKQNVENSNENSILSDKSSEYSDVGFNQMENMLASMSEINKSTDEIKNIIDIIDDIAFQTNMLALNAAVEAARAGEAGMGFAVVADEVKNLANRSADSAKETSKLIKETIIKIESGLEISKKMSDIFKDILTNSKKASIMSKEVETASRQQDIAITQLDNVVQSNASMSEETASAAEELQSQVGTLNEVVNELYLIVNGKEYRAINKKVDKNKNNNFQRNNETGNKSEKQIKLLTNQKDKNEIIKNHKIDFEDDEEFQNM
jgi:methyl-accepting chemotaxis protein